MPTFPGSDGTLLHFDDFPPPAYSRATLPIITLAGGAARHPAYLEDLAGLGDRHRLIMPHLRGVGNSPMPESPELGSFWRQAADLESLRRHLGVDRIVMLGHSAGTRLAISYAAQYPAALTGMVLVTPPAGYLTDEPSDVEELRRRRRGEPAFDTAVAAMTAGPDLSSEETFGAWQEEIAAVGYATWGDRERAHANAGQAPALAAARAFFSVPPPDDLSRRLGEVTAPVLVIAGALDCIAGRAQVVALAEHFPAGRTVVIDRCGHYPWVEQPAAFRQAVDGFLDPLLELSPPSGG